MIKVQAFHVLELTFNCMPKGFRYFTKWLNIPQDHLKTKITKTGIIQ